MSELKPAVCNEMPFAPHGEELGLLIRVTDSRRFAVVAVSTTCGFCVSEQKNLPKHQKSSCCGGQVGTLVLAAANALAKRGLLPIEENIIGVRTMAHLELLGPAVAEALGSCKGQLYGAIENKRSAAKPTFLKSLVVLQVAVLEQPLPLDSQQPAAALCLGACASGFAHTWLPLDAAPSVAKAAAKAYAEANAARLPAAVGLLGLQAKATQRVLDSLRELAAAHGERLNVVEGQQAVLLERLTAVEAVLRIQRTQRRRYGRLAVRNCVVPELLPKAARLWRGRDDGNGDAEGDADLGDERVEHAAIRPSALAARRRQDGDVEERRRRVGWRFLHLDDCCSDHATSPHEREAPRVGKLTAHDDDALVDVDLAQHPLRVCAADLSACQRVR